MGPIERIPNAPVVKGVKIETIADAYKVFEGRPLTYRELQSVTPVFSELLDLGQIRVHDIPKPVLQYLEGRGVVGAATPVYPNEVALGKGVRFEDYGMSPEGTVAHEITHDYQFHGGKSTDFGPSLVRDRRDKYEYGSPEQLRQLRQKGVRFQDFSMEQQGRMVENYINFSQGLNDVGVTGNTPKGYREYLLGSIQPYIDDLRKSPSYGKTDASVKLESAVSTVRKWLSDVRSGDFSSLRIF